MKKHELLEKAMIDYPKGTIAIHEGSTAKHYSTGLFKIKKDDYNGVCVLSDTETECFYSENTNGEYCPTWAVPVKESILSGKCAIAVNNEREFKLLMKHYENKGWECVAAMREDEYNIHGIISVSYHDKFHYHGSMTVKGNELHNTGYKLIPFADFAKEIGIEVPVFIMKSEDGADLYVDDENHVSTLCPSGKWSYAGCQKLRLNQMVVKDPIRAKAFSTRRSAEKWVLEANKPKLKELKFKTSKVNVTSNGIYVYPNEYHHYHLNAEELEQAYATFKSLQ